MRPFHRSDPGRGARQRSTALHTILIMDGTVQLITSTKLDIHKRIALPLPELRNLVARCRQGLANMRSPANILKFIARRPRAVIILALPFSRYGA